MWLWQLPGDQLPRAAEVGARGASRLAGSRAQDGQRLVDIQQLVSVDVDQFYGIEIEEFPAQIAQVALWLVDHQMNTRVSEEFGNYYARIPLVSTPHIVHGNALTLDWDAVLPRDRCCFVLGNPPFAGHHLQSAEQKNDMLACFRGAPGAGVLDLVSAWYCKAADYIKNTHIRVAFVSTNSITQGEQVGILWRALLARAPLHIHFAHRTFRWANEASGRAHVYCVIIAFASFEPTQRTIFEYQTVDSAPLAVAAASINPYLVDAPWVLLPNVARNLFGMPEMMYGSKPTDGGHYLLTDSEKDALLAKNPGASKFLRRLLGAQEFL